MNPFSALDFDTVPNSDIFKYPVSQYINQYVLFYLFLARFISVFLFLSPVFPLVLEFNQKSIDNFPYKASYYE